MSASVPLARTMEHQRTETPLSQSGTGELARLWAWIKLNWFGITAPNPSGLVPLGHAVLVKPYIPEIKTATSMIVIPDQVRQSMQSVDQRAVVAAIGPLAWKGEGRARASVGDKVLVTRFAGYITNQTADGAEYRLVNDRDIFCRIEWDME